MNTTVKGVVAAGAFAAAVAPMALFSQSPAQADTIWGNGRHIRQAFGVGGERIVHWSGVVDDRATIFIHNGRVRSHDDFGKAIRDINVDEMNALPDAPGRVTLRNWDGRGNVHVVQQPRPWNNFTAAVRIVDPQPGASHYDFTLVWNPM